MLYTSTWFTLVHALHVVSLLTVHVQLLKFSYNDQHLIVWIINKHTIIIRRMQALEGWSMRCRDDPGQTIDGNRNSAPIIPPDSNFLVWSSTPNNLSDIPNCI